MKSLKESILSTSKVGKYDEWHIFQKEHAYPKEKKELQDTIKQAIKLKGTKVDLNWIDVSKITDMDCLFMNTSFNGDISKWNTNKVRTMAHMFANSKFDGDISKWNVSNVKSMRNMFHNSEFNKDISKWDVRQVNDMTNMFRYSDFKQDLSKWDTRSISKYIDVIGMFDGTPLEYTPPKWYKKLEKRIII